MEAARLRPDLLALHLELRRFTSRLHWRQRCASSRGEKSQSAWTLRRRIVVTRFLLGNHRACGNASSTIGK